MSRLLKLVMVKYKGRLQFNASGAGSITMLEVANRLGLNVERANNVPCCLQLQESIPTPPPYTYDLRLPAALSFLVWTFLYTKVIIWDSNDDQTLVLAGGTIMRLIQRKCARARYGYRM